MSAAHNPPKMSARYFEPNPVRSATILSERALPDGCLAVDTIRVVARSKTAPDQFDPVVTLDRSIVRTKTFKPRRFGPFAWWADEK